MNKDQIENSIIDYLNGELNAEESAVLSDEVNNRPEMQLIYDQYVELFETVDGVHESKVPPSLNKDFRTWLTSESKKYSYGRIFNLNRHWMQNAAICGLILAVGLLIYIVLNAKVTSGKPDELLGHYLPRITVAVFIEIFSFFFLKLYRNGLTDMKYFQNELTNIDSKYLALEIAIRVGDAAILSQVVHEMVSTDRNARLQKGETTVELERLRAENQGLRELFESAKGFVTAGKR